MTITAGIILGATEGVAGQVLTSGGPGAAAIWAAASPGAVGWVEVGSDLQLDNGYTNLLLYPASGSTNILAGNDITPISDDAYELGSWTSGSATKNRWHQIHGVSIIGTIYYAKIGATNMWQAIFGSDVGGESQWLVNLIPNANITYTLGKVGTSWLAVYTQKLLCDTGSSARLRLPVGTNMYG